MNIVSLILAILKFANALFSYAQQQRWIKAGEDGVLAREAAELFRKTEHAKEITARVETMSEDDLDALLARLGEPSRRV